MDPRAEALPLIEIRAPRATLDYQNSNFKGRHPVPVPWRRWIRPLAQSIQRLCLQAYTVVGARGWDALGRDAQAPAGRRSGAPAGTETPRRG